MLIKRKLLKLQKGQILIKKKGHGKPDRVQVVDTDDHLTKLRPVPGRDCFFINTVKVPAFYRHAEHGEMLELFPKVDHIVRKIFKKHLIQPS